MKNFVKGFVLGSLVTFVWAPLISPSVVQYLDRKAAEFQQRRKQIESEISDLLDDDQLSAEVVNMFQNMFGPHGPQVAQ